MTKKRLKRLFALCLVVCMCISMFAACRKQDNDPDNTVGADGSHIVTVTTENGMPIEGIGVYIYTDKSLNDLVWFAKTDAVGQITFSDTSSKSYVAVLKDVPTGYMVEEYYTISGADTRIKLAMELVTDDDLAGITMNLGDAMFDFAVTACDGTEYKLSELLAENEAVVLNFWYLECAPCKAEFPYLQEAYEKYSDKIEVLALNPVNQDDDQIAAYKADMGLTFPMAQCSIEWQNAMQLTGYPTTVVIDRYGMITFMHMGSVTDAETFETVFEFFTAEDYEHTVVEDIEEIQSEEDDGEFKNPTEVGGVTSFQVQVEPGQVVYVDVYKVVGTRYVTIKDADAYVIYKNKTYSPTNGTVSMAISSDDTSSAVKLGFGNNGTETKLFTINFSLPGGTMGNPYPMSLGEFTASVSAGNDQGVFYTYTATEDGVLTVQCLSATAGVPYNLVLYNLNSYAYRTLGDDGTTDGSGYPCVSVNVKAGHKIQFVAGSLPDSSGSYPAATFKLNAFMGEATDSDEEEEAEKIVYSVTVTDGSRTPVAGATVYVDVDGTSVPLTTNTSGVAATKLLPGTYQATLKVPAGYSAKTTEFSLTETIPSVAIKLDKKAVETASFTVKVVNAGGSAISGALVVVGDAYGYTDAAGSVTLTAAKDTAAAYVVAAGYADGSFTFAQGSTTLTATMTAGTSSGTGTTGYTVKVVDYYGKPVQNVAVTFLSNGAYAGMKMVDSNGTATMKLLEGDYTVSLAFSGSYHYNAGTAVLSASQTSVTIQAIAKRGTEAAELFVGGTSVGDAYYVPVGATYVSDMQANVMNYYLFTPEVSGVYSVTTTSANAKVSYWAASTYPNLVGSNYDNNTFTVNVKESMLGNTLVIGINGATDAVLVITRTGDAILDESDIVAEVYKGTVTPTAYKVKESGTLTYFDLTASGYTLVKDGAGYYHLNTVTGPLVYVNLGQTAPYIQFSDMLGVTSSYGTNFGKTFYDDNGTAVRKENYTELMMKYCQCMDEDTGLYPLNDDLIYMIRQGGGYKGWWDSTNANYLFSELSGLNTEIAWMFACCYFK